MRRRSRRGRATARPAAEHGDGRCRGGPWRPAAALLLTDLAAGATAAVVLPEHSTVRAVHDGDSWRLNGSTGTTLGICAAQRILVAAHAGRADLWFVLDAGSGSGSASSNSAAPT